MSTDIQVNQEKLMELFGSVFNDVRINGNNDVLFG